MSPLLPPDPPPRPPTRAENIAVGAIAVAAAVGALLADGMASGWQPADLVWRGAFAAVCVLAGAKARRWTWLVAAGVATVAAPDLLTAVPAAVGLVAALVSATVGRRTRVAGALVVGLAVQTLLRLDLADPHGLSTLVAAGATLPVLWSGYRRSARATRRTVRVVVAVGGLVAIGLAVAQSLAVLDARGEVARGIDAAQAGFDAARDGEEAAAVEQFEEAAAAFEVANDALSTPWARAGRAVPLLGQHARAMAEVTQSGVDLAGTAAQATGDAPIEELQFTDGVLDLDQVAAFREPLARAEAALADAEATARAVDSGWLLPPLADRVDQFEDQVAEALPQAETAAAGVEVAPGLFGGDGLRRYFVAFVTPAEQRGLGGFLGNYGILNADGGDVTLVRSEEITALRDRLPPEGAPVTEPADYVARYGRFRPDASPGDATVSPDLPAVSTVVDQLFQASGGLPVDGVILVDPFALEALLTFTGPITVSGYDTPLTSENAADVLLRDQYLSFDDRAGRKDFLEEASRRTFEALTSGDLPGPRRVGEVLGPMVDQGRLLVHSFHPEEQAFFQRLGLDGAFPAAEGGDLLAVTTQNSGHNKGDVFLTRSIDYRATVDPGTGEVEATATVTLVNDAPAGGLPDEVIGVNEAPGTPDFPDLPPGTNRMYLSLYTPLVLQSFALDGQALPVEAQQELGVNVYARYVAVPPGSTVTVTMTLRGGLDLREGYRLVVAGQPTVNPDTVTVGVDATDGWRLEPDRGFEADGDGVTATWEGPEDRVLRAGLAEAGG